MGARLGRDPVVNVVPSPQNLNVKQELNFGSSKSKEETLPLLSWFSDLRQNSWISQVWHIYVYIHPPLPIQLLRACVFLTSASLTKSPLFSMTSYWEEMKEIRNGAWEWGFVFGRFLRLKVIVDFMDGSGHAALKWYNLFWTAAQYHFKI